VYRIQIQYNAGTSPCSVNNDRCTPALRTDHSIVFDSWCQRARAHASLPPNGISICSFVLAALRVVTMQQTDRHTDRPRYSVRSNRQHLDIAAVAAAPTEKVRITAATHVRSGKYCSHAGYFMDSIMDWSMSPKLCLLRGWALPSSTWFRGPTRVHTPITISIGSSVLAQCIVLTNAQTSVTSATIGRINAPCRPLHSKFEN